MDSQIVMPALTQALEDQALCVYRSFDLRTAISVLPDCSCPHHGTDQCTCQYSVLLIYGDAPSPVLLVAHGRDGQTWLSVSAAKQSSTSLQQRVLDILAETLAPDLPAAKSATNAAVPTR